jgi:hypothetical protein
MTSKSQSVKKELLIEFKYLYTKLKIIIYQIYYNFNEYWNLIIYNK